MRTDTLSGSKAAAQRSFVRGPPMRPKKANALTCKLSIKALPTSPFGVGRSRNESTRLSEEFYESQPPNLKQVSRRNFCGLRGTAGHPIAQFRGLTRSLIIFLSTHDRELLAQTAKNRFQPWNRGKKLNCPRRGSRARDRRDTRAGRKLVLKLRGGARARKPR